MNLLGFGLVENIYGEDRGRWSLLLMLKEIPDLSGVEPVYPDHSDVALREREGLVELRRPDGTVALDPSLDVAVNLSGIGPIVAVRIASHDRDALVPGFVTLAFANECLENMETRLKFREVTYGLYSLERETR